jgi:predicted RNase H-like HicB family nuclease
MPEKTNEPGFSKSRRRNRLTHLLSGREHERPFCEEEDMRRGILAHDLWNTGVIHQVGHASTQHAIPATPEPIPTGWESALTAAMEVIVDRQRYASRLLNLEARVEEVVKKTNDCGNIVLPIRSLAPWNLDVKKDIAVIVQKVSDEDFVATFFDANIAMTGDTQEEAVQNLKALIADTFESLEEEESILGPALARDLMTLRDFVQRRT